MSDTVYDPIRLSTGLSESVQGRFRIVAIAIALTAVVLLLTKTTGAWTAAGALVIFYASGLLAILVFAILLHALNFWFWSANGDKDWYWTYLKRMQFWDMVLSYVVLVVTLSCFTIYKLQVVGADGYVHDALFARWDTAIFGRAPWELTHLIWSSSQATALLDTIYHSLFFPMLLGYLIAIVAQVRPALRYTYMCTFLAGYVVVGMIFAGLLPSAGPVYDGVLYGDGRLFGPLIDQLRSLEPDSTLNAIQIQAYLLNIRDSGHVGFGGGISAMPSMHIVLAFLWVFPAWHLNRWFGVIMTGYALLIWAASVHLGWHYFVDGFVAVVLITPIWMAIGWAFKLYGPRNARAAG